MNSTKTQLCVLLSCSDTNTQGFGVWCCRNKVTVPNCSSKPRALPAALSAQDMDLCQVREVWGWLPAQSSVLVLGFVPGLPGSSSRAVLCPGAMQGKSLGSGSSTSTPRQIAKVTQVEKFNNPALSFYKLGTVAHTPAIVPAVDTTNIFLQKQLQRLTCDSPQPHAHC